MAKKAVVKEVASELETKARSFLAGNITPDEFKTFLEGWFDPQPAEVTPDESETAF